MSFEIGQKVMCVKGRWRLPQGDINRPKFMQIYTIRAYCPCARAEMPSVLLQEIHNKTVCFVGTNKLGEASFAEYFIRPLEKIEDEATTRISQKVWRLLNMPVSQ